MQNLPAVQKTKTLVVHETNNPNLQEPVIRVVEGHMKMTYPGVHDEVNPVNLAERRSD